MTEQYADTIIQVFSRYTDLSGKASLALPPGALRCIKLALPYDQYTIPAPLERYTEDFVSFATLASS